MLINVYQKVHGVIAQWLNFTGDILYPGHTPVRIRIQNPDEHQEYKVQQYNAQRDQRASRYMQKYKR